MCGQVALRIQWVMNLKKEDKKVGKGHVRGVLDIHVGGRDWRWNCSDTF